MGHLPKLISTAIMLLANLLPATADILLTPSEIKQTIAFGPWPPETRPDPSNRFSGNPAAIDLGQRLFFDKGLSIDGSVSCASCHDSEKHFSDGLDRAQGTQRLDRNTPSLWDVRFQRWFGWGGDTDNLWAQSMTPILSPEEMGHSFASLKTGIARGDYFSAYEAVFGAIKDQTSTEVTVNVGKALAAFQETLVSDRTKFDDFRDALFREDLQAAREFPEDAQRGLQIFIGHGRCVFCHSGPAFTNREFHDAGVPYFLEKGRVHPGRASGLDELLASPFTLAGKFSDDAEKTGAWAVRLVRRSHADFGIFRVPSLRGVAVTAPYMHDGSLKTLREVVEHYNTIDIERLHTDGEAILRPLDLSEQDISDLIAFLETLGPTLASDD